MRTLDAEFFAGGRPLLVVDGEALRGDCRFSVGDFNDTLLVGSPKQFK